MPIWAVCCTARILNILGKYGQPLLHTFRRVHAAPSLKGLLCVQTWISEMATFLKQADPNHLITVGEEGFWGWNSQVCIPPTSSLPWCYSLRTLPPQLPRQRLAIEAGRSKPYGHCTQ